MARKGDSAYSLILQEEKQYGMSITDGLVMKMQTETLAFVVKNNMKKPGENYAPRNSSLRCEKCDRIGHPTEACRTHLRCEYYGLQGHIVDICRKLQKTSPPSSQQGR